MKRQLAMTIEMYPDSWQKKARAGEPISVPGTSALDAYIGYWMEKDPAFAEDQLMKFVKSFRDGYNMLEAYPQGKKRAEKVFQEIGKKISRGLHRRKIAGEPAPSCKANCPACCHIRVTLTESEADVLVDHLRERGLKLDRELVLFQDEHAVTDKDHVSIPYEKRACPVLGEDGNCRAYEKRPLVCRKFMVASPAWMCDLRLSDTAAFIMDPETEGLVAAQMALENPPKMEDDNLSVHLLKRIPADDGLWK